MAGRGRSRLLLALLLVHAWLAGGWRRRMAPAAPRRILVAHHLLLGDTLMLAALLARLRRDHPDAEILLTCPPAILPLFAKHPFGVEAHAYDPRDARTLLAWWRRRGFDLAILPGDNRLSWLARALGSRYIVAFAGDRPAYKNWPVDGFVTLPQIPTALPEIFASLAGDSTLPAYSPADWPLPPATLPDESPPPPYAILHVGAGNPLRTWPAERWHALALGLEHHGLTPVWSAGRGETALVSAIDPERRWPNLAGRLDLIQLAAALRGAALLVCPDTGVMHLGRIVGTPTVAIFGQGSPELFGISPFFSATPFRALSRSIPCRDQQTLFKREIRWIQRCARRPGQPPKGCAKARCILAIGVEEVLAASLDLYRGNSSPANRQG